MTEAGRSRVGAAVSFAVGVGFALFIYLLLVPFFGCATWFERPDVDGPGPQPPAPSPNDQAVAVAGAIGGPTGVIIAQVLTIANFAWQAYRAAPAVQAKRHQVYSSAKPKISA